MIERGIKIMYIMINYYHTLYKKDVTELTNKVEFTTASNGMPCVHFAAGGRRYEIECKYVKRIEAAE